MCRKSVFLTIVCLVGVSMGAFSFTGIAHGAYSLSLSSGVVADPGQTGVPVYFILTSSSSLEGMDMLLDYERDILTCGSIELLTRFQYMSYDITPQGKIRIILRRHHPDSTSIPPLAPGTDTLGLIRMNVTSQDLLVDVETAVSFFENPLTPFSDNRLVESDSSFLVPPQLTLTDGSVFIRHPLYGDVNDDGYGNTIADVIFFINFLAGNQNLSSRQRANSDVNKDGVQGNTSDFVELLRKIEE
jgi:hypothetical protein